MPQIHRADHRFGAGGACGAGSREALAFDDAWLGDVVARCQTSFLASVSPGGQPDVSHRGGPPGFLKLNVASDLLTWSEFVGDGMFKSAGNVRASATVSLLMLDLESGDAAQLSGHGEYRTVLRYKQPRTDGLMTNRDPYPVQGEMSVALTAAWRLRGLTSPASTWTASSASRPAMRPACSRV